MKNKDIKKILLDASEKVTISDYSKEIIASCNHPIKESKQSLREKKKLKLKWALASCAVVVCVLLAIIPLANFFSNIDPIGKGEPLSVEKEENIFIQELIAGGNALYYLGEISSDPTTSFTLGKVAYSNEEEDKENEEEESSSIDIDYSKVAHELDSYLGTTSLFINNSYEIIYIKNNDKAYENYAYKMAVQLNNGEYYTAYYNDKISSNKASISGIMLINNQEFDFEVTQKEKEDEVKMNLVLHSKSHKIKISNENAVGENEYSYEYFVNDNLVKAVEIEVENEKGKTSTEISITENNSTVCYEFEQEEGIDEIECSYKLNNIECSLIIQVCDGYNLYIFEEGIEIKVKK